MAHLSRYLVAKYVRDVQRLESVNIGVILWAPKGTKAMFVPPEEVVACKTVRDISVYKRWVKHWNGLLDQEHASFYRGKTVPRSNPEFLDVLLESQQGNYVLFDGGVIEENIGAAEIEHATKFLYERLVSRPEFRAAAAKKRIGAMSIEALEGAGITDLPGYQKALHIKCRALGVQQDLVFDFGVKHRKKPDMLMLQIAVDKQQSVTSGAFKFDWVAKQKIVNKDRCVALVCDEETSKNKSSQMSIKMLKTVAKVVNVANKEEASDELKRMCA